MAALLAELPSEEEVLAAGAEQLAALVAHDDWLPDRWAQPHPDRYQQNLLYGDAAGRFSVVSFVWAPGQQTPVHDHTTWGLIGVLRGAEISTSYRYAEPGGLVESGPPTRLEPGGIDAVSPTIGDIHRVRNAFADRPSVSIHVYGANIGTVTRSSYDQGGRSSFVSGYSNSELPNPWV
ncbi:MAG TPA: hypothetical protein VKV06_09485 [Acidimicrobiales bacterium]|nr:hypothetical protein [Acidimicrobiales bacterium]